MGYNLYISHKACSLVLGVSNQWNGIWTGIVEWNGGMVKINGKTATNGKLLFKLKHTRHGLIMLLSEVIATNIPYGICIMKQPIKICFKFYV